MAIAEEIYADPSAIALLYMHQPNSKLMADWRWRVNGTLPVTHHGRTEIINAIGLAAFRGAMTSDQAMDAWEALEEGFQSGELRQVDILWRAALNRAGELSKEHTSKIGTRTLDVLHVACAMELGLRNFLSFDEKQSKLAAIAGLKVIKLG